MYQNGMPHLPYMHAVSSSDIDSIGYDSNTDTLYVAFRRNGSVYTYFNVPKPVYLDFLNASSHGEYLAEYIKGSYRYEQII